MALNIIQEKYSDFILFWILVKIEGREDSENNPHNMVRGEMKLCAMISVMTKDWTDESTTIKVATAIKDLGISQVNTIDTRNVQRNTA